MTCEHEPDGHTNVYPKRKCGDRLDEYWEVEGRMVCERHMKLLVFGRGEDEQDEDEDVGYKQDARAMKRTTRFIDLAQLAGKPPAAKDAVIAGGPGMI